VSKQQKCGSCRHSGISAYDGLLVCMIDQKTRPVVDKNKEACDDCEPRGIKINRVWSMPSIWTFGMKVVAKLFSYYSVGNGWVDPFAGENSPAEHRNDIEGRGNPSQLDALEFLETLQDNSFNGVLFDPPYSVEQCLRRYTPKHNGTAGRAEYWAKCKDEIARILKSGGHCISFCWDSVGIGANRGFRIEEILIICHGACHNDTIVTVDRKIGSGEKHNQGRLF